MARLGLNRSRVVQRNGATHLDVDFQKTEEAIESGIKQVFDDVEQRKVHALAVITLGEQGDVAVRTSKHIKATMHPVILGWAQEHLPLAHEAEIAAREASPNIGRAMNHTSIGSSAHKKAAMDAEASLEMGVASTSKMALLKVKKKRISRTTSTRRIPASKRSPKSRSDLAIGRYAPALAGPSSALDADFEPDSAETRMVSCKISEEAKVTEFFRQKLEDLQQQVVKKIAKAWIMGICPKKQAKCPYQDRQRTEKTGMKPEPPEWWPPHGCEFIEPDHSNKEERMTLCLHLLRLRPTPQQLKAWNGSSAEPDTYHEGDSWATFLQFLTPPAILQGYGPTPESPDKIAKRQRDLYALYDAARLEEDYLCGGRDGDDVLHWEPRPGRSSARRQTGTKRSRCSSLSSGEGEAGCYTVSHGLTPKRAKRIPLGLSSTQHGVPTAQMSSISLADGPIKYEAEPDATYAESYDADTEVVMPGEEQGVAVAIRSPMFDGSYMVDVGQPTVSSMSSPPSAAPEAAVDPYMVAYDPTGPIINSTATISFGSAHSTHVDDCGAYQTYHNPTSGNTLLGRQDFSFQPLRAEQNTFQVRHVACVPQPQFDTVPNTPMFSPASLVPSRHVEKPDLHYAQAPYEMYQAMNSTPSTLYHTPNAAVVNRTESLGGQYRAGALRPVDQAHLTAPSYTPWQPEQVFYTGEQQVPIHGLPAPYHPHNMPPNGQEPPFMYEDQMPAPTFPSTRQPMISERGFTGHQSGVGGGAWV